MAEISKSVPENFDTSAIFARARVYICGNASVCLFVCLFNALKG